MNQVTQDQTPYQIVTQSKPKRPLAYHYHRMEMAQLPPTMGGDIKFFVPCCAYTAVVQNL